MAKKPARPSIATARPRPAGAKAQDPCWRCVVPGDCAFEGRCIAVDRNEPIRYSAALAEMLCARLASGEHLAHICREPNMPSKSAVFVWLSRHGEFADAYGIARRWWADAQIERIIEIAGDGSLDLKTDAEGNTRVDQEHIQRSRLHVDTLKWAMAKTAPDKYGDRVAVDVTEKPMTPAQMKAEIALLLGRGAGSTGDAPTQH